MTSDVTLPGVPSTDDRPQLPPVVYVPTTSEAIADGVSGAADTVGGWFS